MNISNQHQDFEAFINRTNKSKPITVIKMPGKVYLDGRTSLGTKGVYAVSLSTASLWAFWNSLRTAWKSFASLASAILLLACSLTKEFQGPRTQPQTKTQKHEHIPESSKEQHICKARIEILWRTRISNFYNKTQQ